MTKFDPHLIGENTLVYDEDSMWINDATMAGNNWITINDTTLNPGKICLNLEDVICNGFIFSYGSDNEVELSKEELESILNLRNEEVKLREENTTVKDAWRKYCVALKLARNSDTDK
jgi:hypothetical protein